jgi:uncharacterized protein
MKFEWDIQKARSNWRKHKVSFDEAASIFGDSFAITYNDREHSDDEERFITFGISHNQRLLVVSHTERSGRTRIISARLATRIERKIYEED